MRKYFFVAGAIILAGLIGAWYTLHSQTTNPPRSENMQILPKTTVSEPTKIPSPIAKTIIYVSLTSNGFSPQVITISPNTRVVWINKSGVEATINSDPHPTHTAYPPLNLGSFGKSNRLSLIFPKAGSHGYHNHFDSTQTGTVIIRN